MRQIVAVFFNLNPDFDTARPAEIKKKTAHLSKGALAGSHCPSVRITGGMDFLVRELRFEPLLETDSHKAIYGTFFGKLGQDQLEIELRFPYLSVICSGALEIRI